jgi:hypothetical protein
MVGAAPAPTGRKPSASNQTATRLRSSVPTTSYEEEVQFAPADSSDLGSPSQRIAVRIAEQKRNERERQGQTPKDDSRQRRPSSPVLTTTDPEQRYESEDHPQQTKDARRVYQAQDQETERYPSRVTELVQAPQQSEGHEPAQAQNATGEAGERPQRPGVFV